MPQSLIPPRLFLRECRRSRAALKLADSMGRELSGGKTLVGALLFLRLLEKHVLAADETNLGVLLPPSVAGGVINAGLALGRRVAINLNYTLSEEQINYCIKAAGIRHVVTSRQFLEKKPLRLDAEIVFADDLRTKATKLDTAAAAFWGLAAPLPLLERRLGLHKARPDDLLTILFTSGSTGEPKGVMLSHKNIGADLAAVDQLIHLQPEDTMLGVLPFFHAFGYTATLWWPLCLMTRGIYHFNPLDARTVGKLAEKYRATLLVATPTFLRGYLRRCEPEQFSKLDIVIVGAEKLPAELREAFAERFKVEPVEGYGATECSPIVSCNIPAHRTRHPDRPGIKHGTVGPPLPGVQVKTVHAETGAALPQGEEGLLLVGGDIVMQGYLNNPTATAEVVKEGWYRTGDMARVDAEGFIEITGRLSRFSKLGGEMVPHLRVESGLLEALGPVECEGEIPLAVTAVPDSAKGERLIVLHRPLPVPVEELRSRFAATGVPNLWLPDRASFYEVEAVPLLGTGKLDLRRLKELALERTARSAPPSSS